MPACNKKIIAVLGTLILSGTLFAQSVTPPQMPSMPSMPTMPGVSGSGSFYKPEIPQFTTKKPNETKDSTDSTSTATATLSEATNPDDLLKSFLGGSSALTASDISTLYDSGLFNNLSSLSGTNFTGTNGNEIILRQILNSLEELKTAQKNAPAAEKEIQMDQQKDSVTFRTRNPAILRFRINGYNMTDSLTTVFFSETEADGSFLLTADRKYFTNQKVRNETFYLLFKTIKSNGATTTYQIIPTVIQDSTNENSFIYRLSKIKNLTAEKTGNLVALHYSKDDFNVDMLLDIDKH